MLKKLITATALISALMVTSASAETVTMWVRSGIGDSFKEVVKAYNAKGGDTVEMTEVPFAELVQKYATAIAGGQAPDALSLDLIYNPAFAAAGQLEDLSDWAKSLPYFNALSPSHVKLGTYDGKVYGMPFDSGVTGMYYRKDYLEQAGYKPEDMQNITWDKFIEIGKAIEAKTGKKMMGLDPNDAGLIRILMQSASGWYFDAEGNLTISNNPALKAALETEQKLLQANIYKPTAGWTEWVGSFTSGDVAAVVTGVWITGTVKAQADQAGKWGVAPIPRMDVEGGTHASNLGGSSWYVMESSAEKDEAIDFLNEIYAKDNDFYQKILTERGAVGSLLAARTGEAYQKPDDFFGGQTVWQNFADWLVQVPAVNYGIFTNELDTAVTANFPALVKGTPVDEVLKAIEDQAAGQIQ